MIGKVAWHTRVKRNEDGWYLLIDVYSTESTSKEFLKAYPAGFHGVTFSSPGGGRQQAREELDMMDKILGLKKGCGVTSDDKFLKSNLFHRDWTNELRNVNGLLVIDEGDYMVPASDSSRPDSLNKHKRNLF